MVARTGLFVKPLPTTPAQGTSPTDGRLVLGGLFGTAGGCIAGGVFTPSATQMQVTIGASVWRIPDPTNAAAVFLSPADADLFTFSAGPPSGSRIDVLWVKQNNYENSDANSRLTYGVTAGIASATPTAPALLAGQLKLGQLTVPAGASNAAACTLQTLYPATLAPLAISAQSAAALALVPGTLAGQRASAAGIDYRWNGSTWRPWDSDWSTFNPNVQGFSGSIAQAGRYRYTGGKVRAEIITVLGSSTTQSGSVLATLPVASDSTTGTTRFAYTWNYAVHGRAGRYQASNGRTYDIAISWNAIGTGATIGFGQANSAQYMDGLNGMGANDELYAVLEYDPA